MDAKHWAEEFFDGVRTVRLERDHPKELRGRYGRLLTYVIVRKDGEWLNYNVECVRAGMSPYFTKYGYSRRFHDDFVEAQRQARDAERGIWEPGGEHYLDYDIRLRWWNARAQVIQRFEQEAEGRDDFVVLTNWDAIDRLAAHEGQEVAVLATVGDIRPRQGKRPARVMLSRRMFSDFPLIFFDDDVFARSEIDAAKGEYVRVIGTVTRYQFRQSKRQRRRDEPPPSQLQIQIRRPEQIAFVDTRPTRMASSEDPRGDAPPAADPDPALLRDAEPDPDPAPPDHQPTPSPTPADAGIAPPKSHSASASDPRSEP